MRLRQLARKLSVQPDKIIALLAEHGHVLENEANSKLTEEQEKLALAEWPVETESEEETVAEETALSETPEVAIEEPEMVEPTPAPVAPSQEEVTDAVEDQQEITSAETDKDLSAHEVLFGPPSHATSQVSEGEEITDEPEASDAPALPTKIDLEHETNSYPAYEEDESYAEAELIKTETPQLEGLKVLGKIELPEPKKPEPKEDAEEGENAEDSKDSKGRDRNKRGRGRKDRKGKQRLNPVEYERRKTERAAKKKKESAAKKLKEKKKEHYLSNVTQKKPSASKPEEEEEMAPLPIIGQTRPQPKVSKKPAGPKPKKGLKKLWAWLNGEYDQF